MVDHPATKTITLDTPFAIAFSLKYFVGDIRVWMEWLSLTPLRDCVSRTRDTFNDVYCVWHRCCDLCFSWHGLSIDAEHSPH